MRKMSNLVDTIKNVNFKFAIQRIALLWNEIEQIAFHVQVKVCQRRFVYEKNKMECCLFY